VLSAMVVENSNFDGNTRNQLQQLSISQRRAMIELDDLSLDRERTRSMYGPGRSLYNYLPSICDSLSLKKTRWKDIMFAAGSRYEASGKNHSI
jgi:hypothetical protein